MPGLAHKWLLSNLFELARFKSGIGRPCKKAHGLGRNYSPSYHAEGLLGDKGI